MVALALTLAGCAAPESEPLGTGDGHLRVAVLPDRAREQLLALYEPLVEHLAEASGLEIELSIPATYEELLDWFDEGRVQLAWLGGLTFLQVERNSGARALVMRDVDMRFTSDFLVSRSREEASLREFAGGTLAFGPELSTSGHLMPRYHLDGDGIDPETLFGEVLHTKGHDQTALWVQEGRVDVGAVNSVVVESMFRDGRLSQDLVRVLRTTAPYRNYVWATQPDLPASTRIALQNAFLALQADDPEHLALLQAHGAGGYVPASQKDYDGLRSAARLLNLLDRGDS